MSNPAVDPESGDPVVLPAQVPLPGTLAPSVPCTYCRTPMPAASFSRGSAAKRLLCAACPGCDRRVTLATATWRHWSGLADAALAGTPTVMPRIGGVSLAGRCIAAGPAGEPVGGDFYETIWLDPTRLFIAVGDVAGHGAPAVTRMAQLRDATRALAMNDSSLPEILRRLDRMQGSLDPEDIATIWLGMYDPQTGRLTYASAGHLPPVIAGRVVPPALLEEATAPPLGTGVVGKLASVEEFQLPVGGVLVAYSDGLIERPYCDIEGQLDLLRETLLRATTRVEPTPEELVTEILREFVPSPAAARDDVCVLVLRRDGS